MGVLVFHTSPWGSVLIWRGFSPQIVPLYLVLCGLGWWQQEEATKMFPHIVADSEKQKEVWCTTHWVLIT